MQNVFSYNNHFKYITDRLAASHAERGAKKRFANFLRIQPAFLSQVLSRKYALSLEQADLANEFFGHSDEEGEFFLLLVSRDRAGTARLKKVYEKQISVITEKRKKVIERLGRPKAELADEAKGIYYSSWLYSAVHVGCTIPKLRTRKALSESLGLPSGITVKILNFLVANNLLDEQNDHYKPTATWIRLDKESPHIIKHHANWRQQAVQSLETQSDDELHYSGVFSMDAATAENLKNEWLDLLKKHVSQIENAKEEDLYSIGLDFFKVIRPR